MNVTTDNPGETTLYILKCLIINFLRNWLLVISVLICAINSHAQTHDTPPLWKDIAEENISFSGKRTSLKPLHYRTLSLDFAATKAHLATAPLRFSVADETPAFIQLPLPDGRLETFAVTNAPILADGLARHYPTLHSYAAISVENPTTTARISLTSKGLHSIIISPTYGLCYVHPVVQNNTNHYISYFADELPADIMAGFSCETVDEITHEHAADNAADNAADFSAINECSLYKFRLALSCTGEYTAHFGGTVADGLEALMVLAANTTAVYERELSVTFELVEHNDLLVQTDAENDPFSNDNKFAMMAENQETVESVIGSPNYDVSLVIALVGGGVANMTAVCNSTKARGTAGNTWYPEGYPLEGTLIHELGHMLGAHHSFNNLCDGNRFAPAAFEPGSGNSVMSYAGACAPNINYPRLQYFHAHSLWQIHDFINNNPICNCKEVISTGNVAPVIDVGDDLVLPIGTPFLLNTSLSNPDASQQTFSWEQMNNEIADMPPLPTNSDGPAFRSYPPSNTPDRSFPKLDCLLNPTTTDNCEWETLPEVPRSMDFRFVTRDMQDGIGCWVSDDIHLDFVNSNFMLNFPNASTTFAPASLINVTWNIGGTNVAPISCGFVNIQLSIDGGETYPILLAENIVNNGSKNIQLPNDEYESCRIKVSCNDGTFFDFSDNNFQIAAPNFIFEMPNSVQAFCQSAPSIINFPIEVSPQNGFNSTVQFTATNTPQNIEVTITPGIISNGIAEVQVSHQDSWSAGIYEVAIQANSGSVSKEKNLTIIISDEAAQKVTPNTPENGAKELAINPLITWNELMDITSYEIQLSLHAAFANPFLIETNLTNTEYQLPNLIENTIYYWRVRAANTCGTGPWSNTFAFQTKNRICHEYTPNNMPQDIAVDEYYTAYGLIQVPDYFELSKMELDIAITHTQVGDLNGRIISPQGLGINFFQRPGKTETTPFGCTNNDLDIRFSDEAMNEYETFQNTCGNAPAITGTFQPLQPFSVLNGINSQGAWLLAIDDEYPQDGGSLDAVTLRLCETVELIPAPLLAENQTLELLKGEEKDIDENHLVANDATANDANLTFTILNLPENGELRLYGFTLYTGDTFLQSDITNGGFSYLHNDTETTTDNFLFQIQNAAGGWLPAQTFNIEIELPFNPPMPNITASITQTILCFNENTGEITAATSNGTPPFEYRLNNGAWQDTPIFAELSNGNYQVTVRDFYGLQVTTNTLTIQNPAELWANSVVDNEVLIITANGGTGDYEYSLNEAPFQDNNNFIITESGEYTVTVRDENGCLAYTAENILINNLAANLILTQDITCHDDNNGAIAVSVSGGTMPYQYSLNEGDFSTNSTFENLPSGSYQVEIQDTNGFTFSTNTVQISNPPAIDAQANVNGYVITVNVENDNPPYTFSFDGGDFSSENTYLGQAETTHDITVRDADDCSIDLQATIALTSVFAQAESTNITCNNDQNGTITANATGGLPPYTYSINGSFFQSENIFTNLPENTYQVIVKDAEGFTFVSNEVLITNPAALSLEATSDSDNILVNASGGTGSLMYSIDGQNYQVENFFEDIENGFYTVYVQDENGCNNSLEITHVGLILSFFGEVLTDIECTFPMDLEVNVCVEGGIPPYSVSATPLPDNTSVIDGDCPEDNLLIFNELNQDIVEILVVDATNAIFAATILIELPDSPVISTIIDEDNLSIAIFDGTPPYSISLNNSDFSDSLFYEALPNGIYNILVEDANGCQAETNVEIDYLNSIFNFSPDANKLSFSVQPNPSNGNVTIASDLNFSSNMMLTLYSINGQEINQYHLTNFHKNQSFDWSYLPNGVYEIVLQDGQFVGHQKWVKL